MTTVFVTGAAGMIGYAVCEMLLSKGYAVIGIDSRPMKIYNHNFRFEQCDISDKNTVKGLMRDASILMHLGCTVDNDFTAILSSQEDKISGGVDKWIYKTAVEYKYTDIYMLSTYQVYVKPTTREPVREEVELKPASIYGKLKMDSEDALRAAVKKSPTNAVIMRLCPIYTKTFIDNLCSKVQDPKDGSYFVYGYGDYGYSFTCLYNLLDFIAGIMANEENVRITGEYNVVDSKPIMAKEIIEMLKNEHNVQIVQSRTYASDAVKNQFSLFASKQIKTEYRYSDPTIACSNITYDNIKAKRFATFRWKLSNTK